MDYNAIIFNDSWYRGVADMTNKPKWKESEERMNIIGQNGNDGLHYDSPTTEQVDISSPEEEREFKRMEAKQSNKYTITVRNAQGDSINCDIYDLIKALNITNPALQHLFKKVGFAGMRGHKDKATDMQDIIDSAVRAKELEQ